MRVPERELMSDNRYHEANWRQVGKHSQGRSLEAGGWYKSL